MDLPVELWQMVFSNIAKLLTKHPSADKDAYNEVKRDLAACTLVSRRWCNIAQPYLFQDVRLTLDNKNLEQIHKHFVDRPQFCGLVKRLHLSRFDRCPRSPFVTRDGALVDFDPCPKLSVLLLVATLQLFPKLRHLRLVDIFFPHMPARDAAFLQDTHAHAGKLAVDVLEVVFNICFLDYAARQRHLLACFASVGRLLVRGRAHWGDGPVNQGALCVPRVHALQLEDAVGTHQILTLLQAPSQGACVLEDLSIERINSGMTDDYLALQGVLDVVGPRLRHFRCNMARNPQDILMEGYFPARPIDITPCTELQSLTLGFQLPASRASSAQVWFSVLETLMTLERQAVLPPLNTLVLEVEFMDLESTTWRRALETAVCVPPSLRDEVTADLQMKLAELGIPAVEPLLLRICQRARLTGVVFRGPAGASRVFSPAYRASLALSFPELHKHGLLEYQERGIRGEGLDVTKIL